MRDLDLHNECGLIESELTRNLEAINKTLADDTFAENVGRACYDKAHDKRWCQTCESRLDGIDAYRIAIKEALKQIEESK